MHQHAKEVVVGIIQGMADGIQPKDVTSPLISWSHAHNDSWVNGEGAGWRKLLLFIIMPANWWTWHKGAIHKLNSLINSTLPDSYIQLSSVSFIFLLTPNLCPITMQTSVPSSSSTLLVQLWVCICTLYSLKMHRYSTIKVTEWQRYCAQNVLLVVASELERAVG